MRPPAHTFCTVTRGGWVLAFCIHCDAFFSPGAHFRVAACQPMKAPVNVRR